ncbi:MAG TPA: paraquat-inducible protein A [Salinivirga sp.]|uniref:paraquat-inducible protein A n=1 Tax=Salinivirga sp. TaxID=1970192 RepID=UPI002B45F799|nr:paraquat-inducible protein A [Salinivirga sp.]HKK59359.1 paraquat-inducible protein A [Salinivirga sp.]
MQIKRKHISQIILILFSIVTIGYAFWSGYRVHTITATRTELKTTYSQINDIYYGLLSVEAWEKQVKKIVQRQISNFELSQEQLMLFRAEIDKVLQNLITKTEQMVQTKDSGWRAKLTKLAVKTFVDTDKIRKKVPEFTDAILKILTRPENIERLKGMARDKLNDLSEDTYDKRTQAKLNAVYEAYGVNSKDAFNKMVQSTSTKLHKASNQQGQVMVILVVLFLLMWFFVRPHRYLHNTYLILAALLALVVLFTGVTTPMLEIDARITNLDFMLLGEHVTFEDQMIFYQSKSILDVVTLLLQSKPFDSIVVGLLILSFSVLLPVSKIISLILWLFSKKVRKLKAVNWLTFWSGKWSMADVMVVAIFMSYVAFDRILENQLRHIDRDTEAVTALTTNNTGLQAGFFIFVTYVFFSMILSAILKRVVKNKNE